MTYTRSQMLKHDYKWTARADNDNPRVLNGKEHSELNRKEGYEVLWFINSLVKTWQLMPTITNYRKLEYIIRDEVPPHIHKHGQIKNWIEQNCNIA